MSEPRPAILVVDDDPDVRFVLQRFLLHLLADHDILATANAAAALSLLDRAVVLVFTNHILPEMSGEQLAQHIKAHWPTTRIVMVSGMDPQRLAEIGQALGLDGVLAKPFTIEQVRALLDALLP